MVFKQMDFKSLVFGSVGKMSSNVRECIKLVVDYGAEHLGRTMVATTVEAENTDLRRYISQLSAAN